MPSLLRHTFQFLDGFDIVALSETQLPSILDHLLPNHTLHAIDAKRHACAGEELLLGVRNSLHLSVQSWAPSCGTSGILWAVCVRRDQQ